jgi:hypothetical protein
MLTKGINAMSTNFIVKAIKFLAYGISSSSKTIYSEFRTHFLKLTK